MAGTRSESTCVRWGWEMPQMSGLGMGFWSPSHVRLSSLIQLLPGSRAWLSPPFPGTQLFSSFPLLAFAMAVNPAGPESLWAQPKGIVCGGAKCCLLGEASYVTCNGGKRLLCYSNSHGVPSAYFQAEIISSLNCLVEKHHKFGGVVFVPANFLVLL